MEEQNSELLTVAEAAKTLKVSPFTVYRWIAKGTLPAVRFSRKVIRIRRSDLEAIPGKGVIVTGRYPALREPAVAYKASANSEEVKEVERVLAHYRKLTERPRSPDEPPKGSREAVLRHVGVISKEEGEELYRTIMEAREASIRDQD